MPLSELVSSSCSNSAQSAYFRLQSSQTSGDFMGSLLVAPGASKPRKIRFRRTGREKRGSKSQSDLLGGDARSRRAAAWMLRPKARLDRRPGSTDCPGRVLWKPESRFEAGQIWWSGVRNDRFRLPIE